MRAVLLNLFLLPLLLLAGLFTFFGFLLVLVFFRPWGSEAAYHLIQRRMVTRFAQICIWLIRPIASVEKIGEGFRKNAPQGQIYVLNHKSFSDTFLCSLLPIWDSLVLLNRGAFRTPFIGWGARFFGWLNVTDLSFERWCGICREELSRDVCIVCFPEGTRSGKKPTGPFHGGIFRFAMSMNRPVTPVVITGNEETPARGTLFLKPSRIQMRVLPAMAARPGEKPFVFKERVRKQMVDALALLEGSRNVG